MKRFDSGVSYYTAGVVEIFFPEDDVVCRWCSLLKKDSGLERAFCGKTAEFIPDPDRMIGGICPIMFKNDDEEEKENEHVDSK